MFTGSSRDEQLSLYSQQHIVSTVEDSVLRTETVGLESQEEDAPRKARQSSNTPSGSVRALCGPTF
jgi:hypothetical protein